MKSVRLVKVAYCFRKIRGVEYGWCYGSGRYGGRVSVEGTGSFTLRVKSIRDLERGILGKGTMTFRPEYDDDMAVEVTVDTRNRAFPFLEFSHEPRNGDDDAETYRIELETTQPNYGGERWWFRCPYTYQRCGVLYLPRGGRRFASRKAYRMVYECQKMTRSDRLIRRANNLNYALGGDGNELYEKPKGMWQRTYERKIAEWERAEEKADAAWREWMGPRMYQWLG